MDAMSSNNSEKRTQSLCKCISSYKIMMCIFITAFMNFLQSRTSKNLEKSYAEVNTTAILNKPFLHSLCIYVASCYQDFCKFRRKKTEEKLNKNEMSLEISREELIKRKLMKKYDQLVMLADIKKW